MSSWRGWVGGLRKAVQPTTTARCSAPSLIPKSWVGHSRTARRPPLLSRTAPASTPATGSNWLVALICHPRRAAGGAASKRRGDPSPARGVGDRPVVPDRGGRPQQLRAGREQPEVAEDPAGEGRST